MAVVGLLALLVLGGGIVAAKEFAMLDEARAVKAQLQAIAARATSIGLDLDRPALQSLKADLAATTQRLDRLRDQVDGDVVIKILGHLPGTSEQVSAGHKVFSAADRLLAAAGDAMTLAGHFVDIKEAQASNPAGKSAMAALVELMATSHNSVTTIQVELAAVKKTLDALPEDLFGPIQDARTLMAQKVDQFAPLLASYTQVDQVIPGILGWGGTKRYLVLAEDPAELRPSGGFIGTIGIVTFKDGRLAERKFQDVFALDADKTYPFVKPPDALAGHLLGTQSWQLADANWSPDFPTAAQDALRLYTNESGDTQIDGVIALTTYAIDDLLKATGPITVPEYGVTVKPGETTLTALQNTRQPRTPGANRKAFLDAFASKLMDTLLALPPHKWTDVLNVLQDIGSERSALVWLRSETDEELIQKLGWDGALGGTGSDYLYSVYANVAPASKLDAVTTRRSQIAIALDKDGTASHELKITWQNNIQETASAPYRALVGLDQSTILGEYVRDLAPGGSVLQSASGGSFGRITGVEELGQELGFTVFGNYLGVPPGSTSLVYRWTTPKTAVNDGADVVYRLTIQKQPGRLDDPVAVTVTVPSGARITDVSDGMTVAGSSATLVTALTRDVEIAVRYQFAGQP